MFVNALSCKNGEGSDYYTTLGKAQEDTIILAVNVETDDGTSDGAIRTTANKESEAYLPAEGEGNPYALQGKRGPWCSMTRMRSSPLSLTTAAPPPSSCLATPSPAM